MFCSNSGTGGGGANSYKMRKGRVGHGGKEGSIFKRFHVQKKSGPVRKKPKNGSGYQRGRSVK